VTSNLSILILEVFSIFLVLLKKISKFWCSNEVLPLDVGQFRLFESKRGKGTESTESAQTPPKIAYAHNPPAAPLLKYLLSLIPLALYPLAVKHCYASGRTRISPVRSEYNRLLQSGHLHLGGC
jgi:hypothetical protein